MSLTSGAYKVHSLIQQIFPTPYAVDLENYIVVTNDVYKTHWNKFFRYFILVSMVTFTIPLFYYRIFWLFFHWKSFTIHHVDQIIVHVFAMAAAAIFLPASHTVHASAVEIQYLINQLHKTQNIIAKTPRRFNFIVNLPFLGETSVLELLIYGLASGFFILVLGVTALPFAVSYEPYQWILSDTTIPSKIFAAFIYFNYMTYAAVVVQSSLLTIIIALEGILSISSTIHYYKFPYSNLMRHKFRICYKRYRTLQIFMVLGNTIVLQFLTVLIFVGVLLASSGAFITLKMYNMLNIFMYLLGPATTILCFVFALLLTYLADFPYKNTKIFKLYWKRFPASRENKRLLWACVPQGFKLGPYGKAKAMLGLHICDDIIRNTVTMLLLGGI